MKEIVVIWRLKIMCRSLLVIEFTVFSFGAWVLSASAATDARSQFDSQASAGSQIPALHRAWLAEHDQTKRRDLAGQLLEAVIHDYDAQPVEIADEVARNGAPKNEIMSPIPARVVALDPVFILKDAHSKEWDYPLSPVFRRISSHRIEAWTSREGWLFNANGKMVADVKIPRRDGSGREWFGAFLPNGTWITTDLWGDDKQLNCYDSKASWLWELPGSQLVARLPKPGTNPDFSDEPIAPSIGWARADSTGRRWLVCLGFDYARGYVLVDPARHIQPLSYTADIWNLVYPRNMGVRGMYTALYIDSDDGEEALHRSEPGHGVGVGWPNYSLSNKWDVVVNGGNSNFGFWPDSHQVYMEAERSPQEPHQVWFFNAEGKYEGQIAGSFLNDAANGVNLLIKGSDNQVVEVSKSKQGLSVSTMRSFRWSDGNQAVPLAIYDDLKLGFFLRGSGIIGFNDDARRARSTAEIVLAGWKN